MSDHSRKAKATIDGVEYGEHVQITMYVKKGMTDELIAHAQHADAAAVHGQQRRSDHVSKSVGEDGEEVVIFTAFWETPGRERSAIQPTQRPESQSAPAL
jgi:hypothetical protein